MQEVDLTCGKIPDYRAGSLSTYCVNGFMRYFGNGDECFLMTLVFFRGEITIADLGETFG